MQEFISYKPGRREVWKGHASAEGVRRAIGWDRSGTLVIFERVAPGEEWHGYVVVQRDQWLNRFGIGG